MTSTGTPDAVPTPVTKVGPATVALRAATPRLHAPRRLAERLLPIAAVIAHRADERLLPAFSGHEAATRPSLIRSY